AGPSRRAGSERETQPVGRTRTGGGYGERKVHRQHDSPDPLHHPPHMLKEIAKRGSAAQQSWAWRTSTLSEQLRGQRQAFAWAVAATPAGTKRRTVYDAGSSQGLPGRLVRGEGDPKSKDRPVNEAYDGAGATYDLYSK